MKINNRLRQEVILRRLREKSDISYTAEIIGVALGFIAAIYFIAENINLVRFL